MHDDPLVVSMVARAAFGDQSAWNEIVERYAPLVWSICLRYQLNRQDIDDVGQSVWLLLIENIGDIRQPAALPGWLATTTQRECLRVLRAARRHEHAELPAEDKKQPVDDAMVEQEILVAERDAALRAAFAELPRGCRELLAMLLTDPPRAYAEVSAMLGMAVGSIGPTRLRCLKRLRRSPHLLALADSGAWDVEANQTRGERGD
jgi:RNA polymerase sigma factor (sigma-70 family)